MAEVKEDNPIGTLYHVLLKASTEREDKPIKDVWCNVLGAKTPRELWKQFIDLQLLLNEAKRLISQLPDAEFHLEGFSDIENLLDVTALNNPWVHIKGAITPSLMVRLESAARWTSRQSPNPEEEIASLQSDIESLTAQILKSDSLDAELQTLIVEKLEVLRNGLIAYRIGGIKHLRKVFEETTGNFVLHYAQFDYSKNTEEVRGFRNILSKVWKLLQRFYPTISVASDVVQLLSYMGGK